MTGLRGMSMAIGDMVKEMRASIKAARVATRQEWSTMSALANSWSMAFPMGITHIISLGVCSCVRSL